MNPLLTKTQSAILAKVDPRLRGPVQKIVNAGHQVMFSPQTRHLMTAQLQGGANNPEVIGSGIAKLVAILYNQSRHTAPMGALIPAGMILLCDALDFLEEAHAVEISPDFLAQCTQAAGSAILQALGISPDHVQQAMQQAQAKQGGGAPAAPGPQPGAGAAPAAPAASMVAGPSQGVIGSAMGAQ